MIILKQKITKMRYIIFLLFFIVMNGELFSQCNDNLINKAIEESGKKAIFLKEFKVKFSKIKANQPAKVAKFSAFLKDGTTYRFNTANAKEYEGRAVMQLYRKGKLLGSNLNLSTGEYTKSFDFECNKTATYQVYMSFIEGKPGCAVGILSLLENDSVAIKKNVGEYKEELEVFYLDIENELYIESENENGEHIQVEISNGFIGGENGKYLVRVNELGKTIVTVTIIDSLGFVREEMSKEFKVEELPLPYITIASRREGLISKKILLNEAELKLQIEKGLSPEIYKIQSFRVSDKLYSVSGKISYSEKFTYQQLEFIKQLPEGSSLYISEIILETPGGKSVTLDKVGYILR